MGDTGAVVALVQVVSAGEGAQTPPNYWGDPILGFCIPLGLQKHKRHGQGGKSSQDAKRMEARVGKEGLRAGGCCGQDWGDEGGFLVGATRGPSTS